MATEPRNPVDIYPLVSWGRVRQLLGRSREDLERIGSHAGRYYRMLDRVPIDGGKRRHIDLPTGELATIQRRIQEQILSKVPFPPTMVGAVPGKSLRDSSRVHVQQAYVVCIDLKNCFPRISNRAVHDAFRRTLGCSPTIAATLTRLTTFQRRLPQGASTSSAIANMVLLPLHDAVQSLAAARGFNCTFWVDDITLSGSAEVLESIEEIIRLIHRHGHSIRQRKLLVASSGKQQSVTGVRVNRQISAPREMRDKIRLEVLRLSHDSEVSQPGLQKLMGRIGHVDFLCPSQGEALRRLASKKLPRVVVPGKRERSAKFEECGCARRHRHER